MLSILQTVTWPVPLAGTHGMYTVSPLVTRRDNSLLPMFIPLEFPECVCYIQSD